MAMAMAVDDPSIEGRRRQSSAAAVASGELNQLNVMKLQNGGQTTPNLGVRIFHDVDT